MGTSASIKGSGGSVLINKTAFVDNAVGDDTTGVVGDEALPFKTIQTAVDSISDNDLIVVRPGDYDEQIISDSVTSGLSISVFYEIGASHIYTGSANGPLWNRTAGGSINMTLYGKGVLQNQGTGSLGSVFGAGTSGSVIVTLKGAKTIRSTIYRAINGLQTNVTHENVDLIESTADRAIRDGSPWIMKNIGMINSTASSGVESINALLEFQDCTIKSTSSFAANTAGSGPIIFQNCKIFSELQIGIRARSTISLIDSQLIVSWNNASGHGIEFFVGTSARELHCRNSIIRLSNPLAESVRGSTNNVHSKIYSGYLSNDVQASLPAIFTFTPTNHETGDVFSIIFPESSVQIDYTVSAGDTLQDLLDGLKASWVSEVGSGNSFDSWLGGSLANGVNLDVSSGTALVATSVLGVRFGNSFSAANYSSVVDAGGSLVPTFVTTKNQNPVGIVNNIAGTSLIVDSEV